MSAKILEVENAIAGYLRQLYTDFTQNNVNLLRLACNNARKHAERMHDWEFTKVEAQVTTSATGAADISTGVVLASDGTTPVTLKQPETFYLYQDGIAVPLRHASKSMGARWAKERASKRTVDVGARYLDDNDISHVGNSYTSDNIYAPYEIFMQGSNIQLHPVPSAAKTILIDGFKWMDDYTDDNDTDYFVERGSDYLMYAGIVEVNYLNHVFADNQEGNFGPPVRMRDDALASLIEQDNFYMHNGRMIRR